jgi:hypothetical protein
VTQQAKRIRGLSRNWRIKIFLQESLLLVENVVVIPSKQYLPGRYFSDNWQLTGFWPILGAIIP